MPVFNIDWELPCADTFFERNCPIWKLRLNGQWTIACVLAPKGYHNNVWTVVSIEIHRNNTAGKFSIRAKLRLREFQQNVSHVIETGASIVEICSNVNINFSTFRYANLHGFVNIYDISETEASGTVSREFKKALQLKSLDELSNDFERLLEAGPPCFADVTLKCGGVSIPAHKTILSRRSPVFAAMFSNPMKESHENEVVITDMDESVLRTLLLYMYTGKTSDLTSSLAEDLLFAADKYQLQDLKIACCSFLKETISFKNVWRILVLGDMLAEELKSFAVDYICNTCGKISVLESTEEWKALETERPDLALEISKSLAKDPTCIMCGTITTLESTEEWKSMGKERPDLALEVSKFFATNCICNTCDISLFRKVH